MRKIVLLLFCLCCVGCGDSPARTTAKADTLGVEGNAKATETAGLTHRETDVPPGGTDATDRRNPAASESAAAGNANVTSVRAIADRGSWTFQVTVDHPDKGWKDYADGWDVMLPDGTVVKPDANSPFTRLLLHPHENERPFTRSQSEIVIPDDVTSVMVRAHDIVDGFGGREVLVDLNSPAGQGFTVER